MKIVVIALVAAALLALGIATTYEVPLNLALGWVPFLGRTLSRSTWAGGTVAVSAVAVLLFTGGVHFVGRSWSRSSGGTWKLRWSLAVVVGMFLLFAAGLCLIGVMHQVAWLGKGDEPLFGEAVSWQSSQSNLKWIGIAAANNFDAPGSFPPGGTFTDDGRMLHGWEVHLLPYLGYSLGNIDLKTPWDDPGNAPYFRCIIPTFTNPELSPAPLTDPDGFGLSHYAANSHVMGPNKALKIQDITDGTANTILIGEVNVNFKPWGHPANWRDPATGINRSPNGFGGPRSSGGAQFVMADGSVRFISERVSPEVLRALSTPNGGEDVDRSVLEEPR